jgi:hypothetical protein
MYDQEPVYAAVRGHSPEARVIVPPRKDAVLSSVAFTAPTQRDQQLLAIESEGRFAGGGGLVITIRHTARMPFPDLNGHSATTCERSGMSLRSGKPLWLANCSIGCGNWVVLSPMRSAKSGVQGTTSFSRPFVQQIPARPERDRLTRLPSAAQRGRGRDSSRESPQGHRLEWVPMGAPSTRSPPAGPRPGSRVCVVPSVSTCGHCARRPRDGPQY